MLGPPRAADSPRRWVISLAAAAGVAFCITLIFWAMRAVMDVGGACGSGNSPYVIQTPCPGGVWVMPVGIVLGIVMAFTFAITAPGNMGGLAGLAWCGLFLSLGANFLEYAFDPPGEADGIVWGWLVCGVVFVLMGGAPLVGIAAIAREARASRPGWRAVTPPVPVRVRPRARQAADASAAGVADELERLAQMRREGLLDDAQLEAARRHVLGGDG
jgi:hypothetical protein